MKLLNLSVYRDGTGFARSSIDHILAMDSVGIDIALRPIRLSGINAKIPNRLIELEKKDLNNVTHVLQHYLPQMFTWKHSVKNIGMFHIETTHFKPSRWNFNCNLMDGIVVNSTQNQHACINSLVKPHVTVIPQPIDINKFKKEYPSLQIDTNNKYVFYAIGDYSYRKNYEQLIRAYLNTFDKNDDTVLILKVYVSGKTQQDSLNHITSFINECKQKLRKFTTAMFPEIIVISQYLTDDQINAIHQIGHCFVSVERGAGICLPAMDAVGFGNAVISPDWGGHTDFLTGYEGTQYVTSNLISCYGVNINECPYTDLYTCHEEWCDPDYMSLCNNLLVAYKQQRGRSKYNNHNFVNVHNYESVGNIWKNYLLNV